MGNTMSALSDLATVVELACLTEDRGPDEQRALLAVALGVDKDRGRFTVTNHDPRPPTLVPLVKEGQLVGLTMAQAQAYNRLVAKWKPCSTCQQPLGAHPLEGCPR